MNRKQRRIAKSQGKEMPDTQAQLQQGVALHKAGQLAQGQALYEAILKAEPGHFDALHYSGLLAAHTKHPEKAVKLINEATKINPNSAEAYSNLGVILQELGQWDAALASCNKAIALKPDFAAAYYNRGNVLKHLRMWDTALASYNRAIALKADYVEAHSNRGVILQKLNQWDASLASFNCAIALDPNFALAYSNRGITLQKLKQLDAALVSQDRAIALDPFSAEAYANRVVTLHDLKQLDAALANHNSAITLKPDYVEGHYNRALSLLLSGDLSQGWEEYEWRWKLDTSVKRAFCQPLWLGKESLAGKTILLHSEQGLGDTLQFCRYAPMVAGLGAKVILEVQKPLVSLLADLNGTAKVLAKGSLLPACDFHCPLLSLPLAFKTSLHTIPATGKYLASSLAKREQWRSRLGPKIKPWIGLVWRGRSEHQEDHNRSIPLAALLKHLPPDFRYVSLQKEVNDTDKHVLVSHSEMFHFDEELNDFSDTGALCDLMDVVISVDTSVAHMSGALGIPTWILLPFVPDWRWLLDREDTPWYPTVRLLRQAAFGDWGSVFAKVRAELEHVYKPQLL